jgi:putative ABC transport system ATP-binding protein
VAILELENVVKDYHLGRAVIHAVRGVSLAVDRGEVVAVVGPSGCGKTTMLNLAGCLDEPTSGRVLFEGADVADLSDDGRTGLRLRRIGFIFQTFNLVPVLDAAENIELPMLLTGLTATQRRARVDALVDLVGLAEFARHRPDELSGGQRQRVAIARALANGPDLVIADEPTANLDSETGRGILEAIAEMNRKRGVSFVFSTHNTEILAYARRVVRLRDGVIVDAA